MIENYMQIIYRRKENFIIILKTPHLNMFVYEKCIFCFLSIEGASILFDIVVQNRWRFSRFFRIGGITYYYTIYLVPTRDATHV